MSSSSNTGVKFMVPSSPPSRSRSNTFGATFKITERAMCYQRQQPPTLTVSRRFGSMTSPGQKHSSNRMATGRTGSPTKKRLWTASVASCCTPMNTVLWLNAVTFSSPWAKVDEPRSRSVVKTDYNRFLCCEIKTQVDCLCRRRLNRSARGGRARHVGLGAVRGSEMEEAPQKQRFGVDNGSQQKYRGPHSKFKQKEEMMTTESFNRRSLIKAAAALGGLSTIAEFGNGIFAQTSTHSATTTRELDQRKEEIAKTAYTKEHTA